MTETVRLLPSGPHAVLAEYRSLDAVMDAADRLRSSRPPGVVDVVPAARTVLVVFEPGADRGPVLDALRGASAGGVRGATGPLVSIEVRYDGADLRAVAAACSMTVDDVVAVHSSAEYVVAFCGFVPGFSYLVGLDPRLHLPRRTTPRTRVPDGSVAIAGEYAAVYPDAVPGGWHLLGTTDAVMWDDAREVPALLPPGARVRFVAR
jgi:KipI family sensor histidine kinase inhibitor